MAFCISSNQQCDYIRFKDIDPYFDSKFFLNSPGVRPKNFLKEEITNLGLDKMLEIYAKSYERLKAAMN